MALSFKNLCTKRNHKEYRHTYIGLLRVTIFSNETHLIPTPQRMGSFSPAEKQYVLRTQTEVRRNRGAVTVFANDLLYHLGCITALLPASSPPQSLFQV